MEQKQKIWLSIGIIVLAIAGFSTFFLLKAPKEILNQTNISEDNQRHEAPSINVSQLNTNELKYYNTYYNSTPNTICSLKNLTTAIQKDQNGNPLELCIFPDGSSCVVYYVYAKDIKKCPQLTNLIN